MTGYSANHTIQPFPVPTIAFLLLITDIFLRTEPLVLAVFPKDILSHFQELLSIWIIDLSYISHIATQPANAYKHYHHTRAHTHTHTHMHAWQYTESGGGLRVLTVVVGACVPGQCGAQCRVCIIGNGQNSKSVTDITYLADPAIVLSTQFSIAPTAHHT